MSGAGEPVTVFQWAQEHGEVGGVLTSHSQQTATLRAEGVTVTYVDTGSARRAGAAVPQVLPRRALHVLHLTRLWRATVMAPAFRLLRGRRVLVLHSGSTRQQVEQLSPLRRRGLVAALSVFEEIWAVNDEIRAVLPPRLRDRVTVVTPFDPAAAPEAGTEVGGAVRRPHALALATNAGLEHYNALLGIEVVRSVRESWADATLEILAYGNERPGVDDLRRRAEDEPWLTVRFDSAPADVARTLGSVGTFLRPTSWDGDSVIVREAQACGARVIASDVSPRPVGVVLAPLTVDGLAAAVLHGGPVSDGAGLATTTLADATRAALGRTGRR